MRSSLHHKLSRPGRGYEEDNVNPATTEGWRWRAYELMVGCLSEDGQCVSHATMATDVWSFAMTIVEVRIFCAPFLCTPRRFMGNTLQIYTGSIPFSHIRNDAGVISSVALGGRPERTLCPQINDDIWAMLEISWDVAPNRRPSMATLCQFFASQVSSMAVGSCRL